MDSVATEFVDQSAITGIAFFYCDGSSQRLATDSAIIFSSILRQLVTQCFSQRSNQSVMEAVKTYFTENTIFKEDFVLSSLKWVSRYFSEIFIIIDGVDECSDRNKFCESLGYLVETDNVKVLVASRPEHDIATADVFLTKPFLNIDEDVKLDISTHVNWCMEKDKKFLRYRPELKAELLGKLTTKCNGM